MVQRMSGRDGDLGQLKAEMQAFGLVLPLAASSPTASFTALPTSGTTRNATPMDGTTRGFCRADWWSQRSAHGSMAARPNGTAEAKLSHACRLLTARR